MTPEEQALKASIEQRLKKLTPNVVNTGTGLRVEARGGEVFLPYIPGAQTVTKSIS
jgi:hypothetical protein